MMRILINRSDAIGDTILTTPMAQMLKEKYPNAKVTFLLSSRCTHLLDNHPYVDDIKIYHRKGRFYHKIKEIFAIFNEVRPTHYIFVGGGYLPNMVAWLYRIPFRGGLKSRWHTFLFLNHGIRQKRSMVSMHEMEFNLNLLAPLGIQYHYSDLLKYAPVLKITEEEKSRNLELFQTDLEKNGIDKNKKLIFVHPGMTGHTLNWSSRNYGRFIVKHAQKFPNMYTYVISYTPSDDKYINGMNEILNREENKEILKSIFYFNGAAFGIRAYMSVLSKAALFLGPSTGTTHIATALGIPVVGVYSPIKVQSSKRWGPVGKQSEKLKIISPDVICGEVTKCAMKECPYFECMGKIEVEDVVKISATIME